MVKVIENGSLGDIINEVEEHEHLIKRILKEANSPLYPKLREVTSVKLAILSMGTNHLIHIVKNFDDDLINSTYSKDQYEEDWELYNIYQNYPK